MDKACPVVLQRTAAGRQVLVFHHPLAGVQLVKGTVATGESVELAAVRELAEESGIQNARVGRSLGWSSRIAPHQTWHFLECICSALPDRWTHVCADDGGHLFSFSWWSLTRMPDENWHPVFQRALAHIRQNLPE